MMPLGDAKGHKEDIRCAHGKRTCKDKKAVIKNQGQGRELAREVRALDAKPDDLSWVPGPRMVERENQVVLWPP